MLYKEIVEKISVGVEKKLKQKEYLKEGLFEVVDQGQSLVGGFSNDSSLVVKCDLPVIVFGDHTKCVKFIDFPFVAGADGVKVLRAKECADAKFLYYYTLLLTKKMIDKGYARHYQFLEKMEVNIPSFDEQKRIVNKIEELFSELDSAVETLKKTKEQLAVYRQSVLKEAFDENFETVLFGTIMQSRLGKMLDAAKNIGKSQKYLRNINVRWLGFDLDDLQEMKIEDSEHDKYLLKNGDLIMCEGGEPGRCAVWDKGDGMFFQKALHRIRFNGEENPKFYMYYFLLLAQSDGLKKYFTGSGIKHLTGQSLVKIVVPVAPLKKQNEIIKKIESQFTVCENIARTVNDALTQADAMRQSILKKAFEGSL